MTVLSGSSRSHTRHKWSQHTRAHTHTELQRVCPCTIRCEPNLLETDMMVLPDVSLSLPLTLTLTLTHTHIVPTGDQKLDCSPSILTFIAQTYLHFNQPWPRFPLFRNLAPKRTAAAFSGCRGQRWYTPEFCNYRPVSCCNLLMSG